LTGFAKSMAAAHSVEDVIRIAAREAQRDLRAAVASISMWERQTGRLRVLANHGKLAAGEAPFPKDESYPVSDFPEILLSEDDLGPWVQMASDGSGDPDALTLDGSQLEGDAQAALDPNYDPPPADNADWMTAMNDYVTAGEDYSGDNTNAQDDNPAQASQEITAGNAALASFNAANGGVLNGTIQS